jgi:hypothetical protein
MFLTDFRRVFKVYLVLIPAYSKDDLRSDRPLVAASSIRFRFFNLLFSMEPSCCFIDY